MLLLALVAIQVASLPKIGTTLLDVVVTLPVAAAFLGMIAIVEEYHFQAIGPF